MTSMQSLSDRFRHWFRYEQDCHAKALNMLASVPASQRGMPEFQKAVDRMAHMVAARLRWLHRLGHGSPPPPLFPSSNLEDVRRSLAEMEKVWTDYLARLDDRALERVFDYQATDGLHYRWNVEGVLTQLFGHAWYHRGQIAQLVKQLGGETVDTDYVFWSQPERIDPSRDSVG